MTSNPAEPRVSGFTLIEVVIVLAVTGLILAMLSQGVRIGLRGTDSYRRVTGLPAEMEPVERALRRMIERMDPGMYPEPPVVRGSDRAIAFTTELPDPATGGSMTADVRLEVDGGRLVLWWTRHARGIPFGAPPPPGREVLLDRVVRLEVSYAERWVRPAWLAGWSKPAMPGLVRLRLVLPDGRGAWPPIIVRPQREQAEE
jgi:prepilin-type N-terminal cleavage/methylation domain-containing protein